MQLAILLHRCIYASHSYSISAKKYISRILCMHSQGITIKGPINRGLSEVLCPGKCSRIHTPVTWLMQMRKEPSQCMHTCESRPFARYLTVTLLYNSDEEKD